MGRSGRIYLSMKRKLIIVTMTTLGNRFPAGELIRKMVSEHGLKANRTTVHKILSILVGNGLLIRYRGTGNEWVYEKMYNHSGNSRLICILCGEIFGFGNEELKIIADTVTEEMRFKVESVSTNIFGLCASCQRFGYRNN